MAWHAFDWAVQKHKASAYVRSCDPSTPAPQAGIYRCTGCGREIAVSEGQGLPSREHHQHAAGDGAVLWQLIVYADHRSWDERRSLAAADPNTFDDELTTTVDGLVAALRSKIAVLARPQDEAQRRTKRMAE